MSRMPDLGTVAGKQVGNETQKTETVPRHGSNQQPACFDRQNPEEVQFHFRVMEREQNEDRTDGSGCSQCPVLSR